MPDREHAVSTERSSLKLTKAEVEFRVARDGERFRTPFIGRGAVFRRPKSGKKNCKADWMRFDSVMHMGSKTPGT